MSEARLRRMLFDALVPDADALDRLGPALVPTLERTLEELEREPLASAGLFPGDLVRRLMELPPVVWFGEPARYARYQAVVRAAALARRSAPDRVQEGFWRALPRRLGDEGARKDREEVGAGG